MASDHDNKGPDYVGYGHPPKDHQFKPGSSGNAAGRPKVAPSLKAVMNKVAARPITLITADGPTTTSMLEAIVLARAHAAIKGGVGAGKAFTSDCHQLGIGVETVEPELNDTDTGLAIRLLTEFGHLFGPKPEDPDDT